MELVELVAAHLLNDLQHLALAVEVARKVDVQPAKSEPRRIRDVERMQQPVLVRRFLRERLQSVAGARDVRGGNVDTAVSSRQLVSFAAEMR